MGDLFREVDEELRSDRFQEFWNRYGKILIGVAVAIVLATGGYRYYEYYTAKQAAEAGDRYRSWPRGCQPECWAGGGRPPDHGRQARVQDAGRPGQQQKKHQQG